MGSSLNEGPFWVGGGVLFLRVPLLHKGPRNGSYFRELSVDLQSAVFLPSNSG